MAQPSNELLRGVPLFAGLSDRDLGRLAGEFNERTFEPGEEIASEGEAGRTFFVIQDGDAIVSVHGEEVGRLSAGASFGEIALIDRGARSATVTAQSEVHCFQMPIWSFRPIVEGNPDMAWRLLETLAERIRAAEAR